MRFRALAAVFFLVFLASEAASAPIYTFVTFDVPGYDYTLPFGINDSGQIVGYVIDAAGKSRGFVKDGDTYTFLTVFGETGIPMGINDAGHITGFTFPNVGDVRGFVKDGDTYTLFDGAGAFVTYGLGINDLGQIVGNYVDGGFHSYLKEGDNYLPIEFPGAFQTEPMDLNDDGSIVGDVIATGGVRRGFVKRGDDYTALDFLSEAAGINDAGLIVGNGLLAGFGYATDGVGVAPINNPDATFGTFPRGINDLGLVVGSFVDRNRRTHGFIATPTDAWELKPFPPIEPPTVPEPAFPLLIGAGLSVWGVYGRRKQRSSPRH